MIRDTRAKFMAIALITLVAAFVVVPIPNKPRIPILSEARINLGIDLAGGAELRYAVLFEPVFQGDKGHATTLATDVIRRRLEARQLMESKVNTRGDDQIVIQLPGVDAAGLRECRRLIETLGKLELHAAASPELQERYTKDKAILDGTKVVETADGARILIQEKPVIEGRQIINAGTHQETGPGGARWFTSFELDAEGAKRFDEAAEALYHQRPRGRIVIMLDDRVNSAPVVQSPSFRGHGRISGAKDENEARNLAIILRSGSLPAPIGSWSGGRGGR